jgi:hypothetical protein
MLSGASTWSMTIIAAPITPARSPSSQGTIRRLRVASGSERRKIPSLTPARSCSRASAMSPPTIGDIDAVAATARTFVPGRQVDDAVATVAEFAGGAVGTIEATRLALGHRNSLRWELNGTNASLAFDLGRLNELQLYRGDGEYPRGFKTVLVTDPGMPYSSWWWPPGHVIGWEHTFVHELHHLICAIAGDHDVAPYGATFEDGYRAAEVCDAMLRSAASGEREQVSYAQKIAIGFHGEPVPPRSRSGRPTTMNS